jgi:hypothetical protein
MVKEKLILSASEKYANMLKKACIAISEHERNKIEICDYKTGPCYRKATDADMLQLTIL